MNAYVYDMIIIGGGPGGYTAALYAARAGLDAVVLEKLSAGGQMAQTHQIDNYPGFPEGIDGFQLAEQMQQQAERFGAKTEYAEVYAVDLSSDPKKVETRFYLELEPKRYFFAIYSDFLRFKISVH